MKTIQIALPFTLRQHKEQTDSMEQCPWYAYRYLASQEIPRILTTLEVHYRIHKGPPPVHVLGQINLIHALPFYFWRYISYYATIYA
jgi:hypothetical protein